MSLFYRLLHTQLSSAFLFWLFFAVLLGFFATDFPLLIKVDKVVESVKIFEKSVTELVDVVTLGVVHLFECVLSEVSHRRLVELEGQYDQIVELHAPKETLDSL